MILKITKQESYELLDAGEGLKLERFGKYTMVRPDPEALWKKSLPIDVWSAADLKFSRVGARTKWEGQDSVPKSWNIDFGGLTFSIKPTSFKHTGLFPEQMVNWEWMREIIKGRFASSQTAPAGPRAFSPDHAVSLSDSANQIPKVLNLFAYTGGATLACAKAGAEVVHVDGSKTAVSWARENAELSGLTDAPIRWIVEDCILFLEREAKRGNKYDGIIMDPPSFGHGPKDELWKIEEHFLKLMDLCKRVLSDEPLFVLINGYTAGYSPIVYENNLKDMMKGKNGTIEIGELAIEDSARGNLLPCGIFARWQR
jgi:23S rRNA (cytosine1962-C5)-methyltransferase